MVTEKSDMLFGTMLGDSAIKGDDDDEGVEPGDLGTRMVEHGECVSSNSCSKFTGASILQAILYCR